MALKSRTVIRAPGGDGREKRSSSESRQRRMEEAGRAWSASCRETAEIVVHQIWYLEGYLEVRIEQSFGSLTFVS